jgi:hypothetical protein
LAGDQQQDEAKGRAGRWNAEARVLREQKNGPGGKPDRDRDAQASRQAAAERRLRCQ